MNVDDLLQMSHQSKIFASEEDGRLSIFSQSKER